MKKNQINPSVSFGIAKVIAGLLPPIGIAVYGLVATVFGAEYVA